MISIKYRLPLLIGTLLFVVIVACSWAAYRSVKASAQEVGRERLQNLTQQLSGMVQQSASALATRTAVVANDPALRRFVASRATASRDDVLPVLQQFSVPADANSLGVEVWNRDGELVLSTSETNALNDLKAEFQQCASEPFKAVGAIRRVKDTAGFPIVVAIKEDDGSSVMGYLVRWRRLTTNPESRQQMNRLLGSNATLYFGNTGDEVWTDLEKFVARPALDLSKLAQVSSYSRGANGEVVGLAQPIAGTPWTILIEFPDDVVQKPANSFLKRISMIGLVVFAVGIAAAVLLSRNITKPLHELTATATAISRGDDSRRVEIKQEDELGQLASAFNAMVVKVRDSKHELERKVQQRTLQLEEANRQLEDLSATNELKRTLAEKEKTDALAALRNTERQLVQSQKLEAVGRLAGGISHDFNNLLTVILGYSDITLRQLGHDHPLRRNLNEIVRASERAASLTRQLLAFSRKQVMQPKVFDVNGVVTELEKMLRRMIGEDIELRVSLHPEIRNIKADPVQLEQVIMNLVVNARDAMPKGGKLTIETGNVYFDETYAKDHVAVKPGNYVMLAISDTGCGMDKETRQHIFEPFFTTKAQGKGTGLGLSTVYGIVKQSGGNIWVYSEEGRGTTFKIYFPQVLEAAEEYRRTMTRIEAPRGSETILLVEDSDWVRKLTRQLLEGAGYRVIEANGAEAAFSIIETNRNGAKIDLVLTDVIMPGMSGNEMSRQLLAKRPDLAVLYMSGYTDDAIVQHGVLEPGINFIQKPFSPDALALKVREVLDAKPQPVHHR